MKYNYFSNNPFGNTLCTPLGRTFPEEKAIKHSRGRNIHLIVSKFGIQVGFIKFCVKISYVEQIGAAGLSSKEKSDRHSRGRNFDPIVFKIVTNVGLIKPQIKFKNELCGANRRGRPSSKKKNMSFLEALTLIQFLSNLVNCLI